MIAQAALVKAFEEYHSNIHLGLPLKTKIKK